MIIFIWMPVLPVNKEVNCTIDLILVLFYFVQLYCAVFPFCFPEMMHILTYPNVDYGHVIIFLVSAEVS